MIRKTRTTLLLPALLFVAGTASAETVELVTYYPSSATTGDLHVTSLTVGPDYANVVPDPGQAFISGPVGIGAGFSAAQPPTEALEVVGNILANGPANSDALFIVDRAANNFSNGLRLSTTGVAQWTLGSRGDGTENFHLFSNADNATRLIVEQGTGNVGIGTVAPNAAALVQMDSATKGVLMPRVTTAQRRAIAGGNPPEGLEVYDTTARRKMVFDGTRWMEVGGDPIGTIKAWHGSFANTPALPWGWLDCSGQQVADAESPYNGQTLPNLNTEANGGRFLRGGADSGVMQEATGIAHWLVNSYGVILDENVDQIYNGAGGWPVGSIAGTVNGPSYEHRKIRPKNMSVVWIIRVK